MADPLPAGWLSADDIRELKRYAADKIVVEMGAYLGRSTVVLSGVASYVISIDRHEGIEGHLADSLPGYLEAVRPLSNVAIVVARFQDFVPLLASGPIDYVFIDGDHDANSVNRDIVLSLVLNPAVIAFHDWDFPEVRETATGMLGKPKSIGGSVATFVRRPA